MTKADKYMDRCTFDPNDDWYMNGPHHAKYPPQIHMIFGSEWGTYTIRFDDNSRVNIFYSIDDNLVTVESEDWSGCEPWNYRYPDKYDEPVSSKISFPYTRERGRAAYRMSWGSENPPLLIKYHPGISVLEPGED